MASIVYRLNEQKEVEEAYIKADEVMGYLADGWVADKESLTKPKRAPRKKNENKD